MAAPEDRHEAAREVIRQMGFDDRWDAVIDPNMPPALLEWMMTMLRAYKQADLDWLIAAGHPNIVVSQPPEFPDSRSYYGSEALVDALLDWPRQWARFQIDPRRVFAADDEHVVIVALHRGRPHSVDLEVEAEISFLLRWHEGLVTHWDMFLSVEEALGRAAERRADRDDDRAAEGDGRERAQEAGAEEARPDYR
jgi:ketosteroid isomerase-like protein